MVNVIGISEAKYRLLLHLLQQKRKVFSSKEAAWLDASSCALLRLCGMWWAMLIVSYMMMIMMVVMVMMLTMWRMEKTCAACDCLIFYRTVCPDLQREAERGIYSNSEQSHQNSKSLQNSYTKVWHKLFIRLSPPQKITSEEIHIRPDKDMSVNVSYCRCADPHQTTFAETTGSVWLATPQPLITVAV